MKTALAFTDRIKPSKTFAEKFKDITREFEDTDEGIKYYQKLYNEYPYIPDILYTLVQAYAKAERQDDARETLKIWLRSHPNDSQAIDWLSILSLQN